MIAFVCLTSGCILSVCLSVCLSVSVCPELKRLLLPNHWTKSFQPYRRKAQTITSWNCHFERELLRDGLTLGVNVPAHRALLKDYDFYQNNVLVLIHAVSLSFFRHPTTPISNVPESWVKWVNTIELGMRIWCFHTRARQHLTRQDKSWTCAFLWCLSHQTCRTWCERHNRNVQHLSCRCLVVVLLWCENTIYLVI